MNEKRLEQEQKLAPNKSNKSNYSDSVKAKPSGSVKQCPPNPGNNYKGDDLLTVEKGDDISTFTVTKWLSEDPVALHDTVHKYKLSLDKEIFNILSTKLRCNHSKYLDQFMGTKRKIEFPGMHGFVRASIPLKSEPVKFYSWWIKDISQVRLTLREKIELIDKVNQFMPKILTSNHKKLLK